MDTPCLKVCLFAQGGFVASAIHDNEEVAVLSELVLNSCHPSPRGEGREVASRSPCVTVGASVRSGHEFGRLRFVRRCDVWGTFAWRGTPEFHQNLDLMYVNMYA